VEKVGLCWGDKKRGRILQAKNQGRKGKQKEQKVSSPALQSEDNLPKERGNFVVVIVVVCQEIFTFLCARALFVSLAEVAVLDSVKTRLHCGRCECV